MLGTMLASNGASTWYYGQSDNSATFSTLLGATPDSKVQLSTGWKDAAKTENSPDTTGLTTENIQVNRPDILNRNEAIIIFGFDDTGLTSSSVNLAELYFVQDFASAGTWNIMGIAAGDANWYNLAMTWNDINGATAGDWTGGTLGGSVSGNYGTFSSSVGQEVTRKVDITNAFKAYLDGTIKGIAFVNLTKGATATASDNVLTMYSNDTTNAAYRPGLLVDAIPEPSAALLSLFGGLGLLTRRKRN